MLTAASIPGHWPCAPSLKHCLSGVRLAPNLRTTLWQALQFPDQEAEAHRRRVTHPQASELGRGGTTAEPRHI